MGEYKHAKTTRKKAKGWILWQSMGRGFGSGRWSISDPGKWVYLRICYTLSSSTEIIALKDYSTGGQDLLISFCFDFSKILRIQTWEKDYCFSYILPFTYRWAQNFCSFIIFLLFTIWIGYELINIPWWKCYIMFECHVYYR